MRPRFRVLVFEDNDFFAQRICDALLAHDADVTRFVGAARMDGEELVAIGTDGSKHSLRGNCADLCFTDGFLIGPCSGVEISRWCACQNMPVHGMSDEAEYNGRMLGAGAFGCDTKLGTREQVLGAASLQAFVAERRGTADCSN